MLQAERGSPCHQHTQLSLGVTSNDTAPTCLAHKAHLVLESHFGGSDCSIGPEPLHSRNGYVTNLPMANACLPHKMVQGLGVKGIVADAGL